MIETSYEARVEQLNRCVALSDGKILYIGASKNRTSFLEFLKPQNTTILEIYKPNIESLQNRDEFRDFTFVHGDILEVYKYFDSKSFDISIWFHGPEHLFFYAIPGTLEKLENVTRNLVTLGCPWGTYKQGPFDGNIWETHCSTLFPENFHEWGYKTDTLGERDTMGSNILAWKFLEGR